MSADETKRLARIAGALYLTMGLGAVLGFHHAPIVQGDLVALGRSLAAPGPRVRLALVADILAMAVQVPLAVLLYELFRPVHRVAAALMSVLLVVSTPITAVLTLDYVTAHRLLGEASATVGLGGAPREALASLFVYRHAMGVLAEEVFWGLWLLPFGWLVMRSRMLPRVLGVLLVIGGVAYVAHSVTSLSLDGRRITAYEQVTMLARAAAEFPVMLWLLVMGAGPRGGAGEGKPSPV